MKHRITMSRPGVYRIVAATAPQSLVQRLGRLLGISPRRPEPARLAPTLAQTGGTFLDAITTVAVSLAALRRARPSHHQETTP
jgi:hypothetical protein